MLPPCFSTIFVTHKAETRSFSGGFGGEKWVEYFSSFQAEFQAPYLLFQENVSDSE
jgi:hypothetical protein